MSVVSQHKSILILILSLLSFDLIGNDNNPIRIEQKILESAIAEHEKISSVAVTIIMEERIEEKVIKKKTRFKIQTSPYRLYLYQEYPNKGLEILYPQEAKEQEALVNPASFPWVNLSLDPLGHTMRDQNHHSIFKSGFSFIMDIVEHLHNKYKTENGVFSYEGKKTVLGEECHSVVFKSPNFTFEPYTIKQGEGLEEISLSQKICDYHIFSFNAEIKKFGEDHTGLEVMVPNDYGKTIRLYFSVATKMLNGVEVYDHDGLFEKYLYTDIQLNPEFNEQDFSPSNPTYNFE